MGNVCNSAHADGFVLVTFALREKQWVRSVKIEAGMTIAAAVAGSGLLNELPDLDIAKMRVGIFGKIKAPETLVRSRDRIEIYRDLIADPKESRRRRAAHRGAGSEKKVVRQRKQD